MERPTTREDCIIYDKLHNTAKEIQKTTGYASASDIINKAGIADALFYVRWLEANKYFSLYSGIENAFVANGNPMFTAHFDKEEIQALKEKFKDMDTETIVRVLYIVSIYFDGVDMNTINQQYLKGLEEYNDLSYSEVFETLKSATAQGLVEQKKVETDTYWKLTPKGKKYITKYYENKQKEIEEAERKAAKENTVPIANYFHGATTIGGLAQGSNIQQSDLEIKVNEPSERKEESVSEKEAKERNEKRDILRTKNTTRAIWVTIILGILTLLTNYYYNRNKEGKQSNSNEPTLEKIDTLRK